MVFKNNEDGEFSDFHLALNLYRCSLPSRGSFEESIKTKRVRESFGSNYEPKLNHRKSSKKEKKLQYAISSISPIQECLDTSIS
jgi:hypothetical protein